VTTSHAEIERAAFGLFDRRGFEATTMKEIAAAADVSERTVFRYFESKNDIPWGQFDETLARFRKILRDMPEDLPLWRAVHCSVVAFNEFPFDADPPHRRRMELILGTPALQAHSVLRYAAWRRVIADHVAARSGLAPTDLLPQVVGQVSLALALSAYDAWLQRPGGASLVRLLDEAMGGLRDHLR